MDNTLTKDMHSEWKEGLNQLGFHIEFDEESKHWFAERAHDKSKIIVSSEEKELLANEIILSYQALLMHSNNELQKQKELNAELVNVCNGLLFWERFKSTYPYTAGELESLIRKSKQK